MNEIAAISGAMTGVNAMMTMIGNISRSKNILVDAEYRAHLAELLVGGADIILLIKYQQGLFVLN